MTWVPEFAVREGDPWAHRKGEPRPLALLWAVYLMGSAVLTIFTVRSLGMPSTVQFVSACRGMIVMVALGLTVLWPAVRLSQEFPWRRWRSVGGDLLVLLAPVQAALWPMPLLTHWSWDVMSGVMLMVCGWGLLAAAVLVWAYAVPPGSAVRRGGAAAVCVMLAVAAPVAGLALRATGVEPVAWLGMLSPVTAAYRLVDAPSGLSPHMSAGEWYFCALPVVVAGVMVLIGVVSPRPSDEPRTDPTGP
jgi:hypothetical protein